MWWVIVMGGCISPVTPSTGGRVEVRPDVAGARGWVLRAERATLLGDEEEAARSWRWAVRDDPALRSRQATFLMNTGATGPAREGFLVALAANPGDVEALVGLAILDGEPWLGQALGVAPCRLVGTSRDEEAVAPCRAWR